MLRVPDGDSDPARAVLGIRLKRGAAVLVAAGAVDTRLVQAGVRRLQEVHREYVDAQRRVDAAQAVLDAARVRVRELRAVQDDAVETLARTLVGDGHRLKDPLRAFGAPAPSTIARLAVTTAPRQSRASSRR